MKKPFISSPFFYPQIPPFWAPGCLLPGVFVEILRTLFAAFLLWYKKDRFQNKAFLSNTPSYFAPSGYSFPYHRSAGSLPPL